ncbi:MAG: hypothetical protein ACI4O9_08285 [Akkermansia sp.]
MIRRLLFVLALMSIAVQAADSLAEAVREQVGVTVDHCPQLPSGLPPITPRTPRRRANAEGVFPAQGSG